MFMLGGYAGYVAYTHTGSFIVAVIAGSLFVGLVGIVMERVIIRHFYSRPHEDQLLVTFGLSIVFVEVVPGEPLMQKPDAFGCKLGDYT
jgi:branched-chain amino acid transport system permease protein